ncbi:hypothetical protein CHLRE_07g327750v5 [Chlamydomonas reinhardtii]|uniref:Ion transport domain-containing protein n=1 Tax=Chlamydomonas reinhardtii TaxID=3055 RepID=A0A2K3DJP8_CHLRE|nr:uncharacterized protein CHLRE_07g327750v5 [Chlamydomonas reinhardtii]PNW80738.1 hypothetical protein CHLRE_07g327750v5 [Chlamydomonas reinhardtii]
MSADFDRPIQGEALLDVRVAEESDGAVDNTSSPIAHFNATSFDESTAAPRGGVTRDANTQSVRRRGAATTFQLPVRSPASVGVGEGVDWGKEVGDLPMEDRVTFRGAPERQNSSGVGQKPSGAPRQRPVSCRSARSQTFLAAQPVQIVQLPYKCTLEDLNRYSYWWLHCEEARPAWADDFPHLAALRNHVRRALLAANLEVCFVRCWHAFEAPPEEAKPSLANCTLDFGSPVLPPRSTRGGGGAASSSTGGNTLEDAALLTEARRCNAAALSPWPELLTGKSQGVYRKRQLLKKFSYEVVHASQLLQEPEAAEELAGCPKEVLSELCFTFAAFQPALLDEGLVKGSLSPLDPDSGTPGMDDVMRVVEDNRDEHAETESPLILAELAAELATAAREYRPELPVTSWLLQAACMCGHVELVEKLLEPDELDDGEVGGLSDIDAMAALAAGWLGYSAFHPLQPRRPAQAADWLDLKSSLARAVLTAHRVVLLVSATTHDENWSLKGAKLDMVWNLIRQTHRRVMVCKPFILALMHIILEAQEQIVHAKSQELERRGRERQERRQAKINAKLAKQRAREDGTPHTLAEHTDEEGGVHGHGHGDPEEDEDDDDDLDDDSGLDSDQSLPEGAALFSKLHQVAVTTYHLAVYAANQALVFDALCILKAVGAWQAVTPQVLLDLAAQFPNMAEQFLRMMGLEHVRLEDKGVPYELSRGFATAAACTVGDDEQLGGTGASMVHFAIRTTHTPSWIQLFMLPGGVRGRGGGSRGLGGGGGGADAKPGQQAAAAAAAGGEGGSGGFLDVRMLQLLGWTLAGFACQGPGSLFLACMLAVIVWGLLPYMLAPLVAALAVLAVRMWQPLQKVQVQAGSAKVQPAAAGGEGGPVGHTFNPHHHQSMSAASSRQQQLVKGAAAAASQQLSGGGAYSINCQRLMFPVKLKDWKTVTALLQALLLAPGVHPSVFGTPVLRALILFKYNYCVKFLIMYQFLLHMVYMGLFITYAVSIQEMEPVEERTSGLGSGSSQCHLPAPSRAQGGVMVALLVITVDHIIKEVIQVLKCGLRAVTNFWDILDFFSIGLVLAMLIAQTTCAAGFTPTHLRCMAAVEVLVLFSRVLYFAMASDSLGSFVRMVMETVTDLLLFFVFLLFMFLGFVISLRVLQGSAVSTQEVFIRLFCVLYGDTNYLLDLDESPGGVSEVGQVITSIFMVLITIVMLNLLISIIGDSYDRIRANESWESLHNKAQLVVEAESQVPGRMLDRVYDWCVTTTGAEVSGDAPAYIYTISPVYNWTPPANLPGSTFEVAEATGEAAGEDEEDLEQHWQGRLNDVRRHVSTAGREQRVALQALKKKVEGLEGAMVEKLNKLQDTLLARLAATTPGSVYSRSIKGKWI